MMETILNCPARSWSDDLEARILKRHRQMVEPILERTTYAARNISYDKVFPVNPQVSPCARVPGWNWAWTLTENGHEWPPKPDDMTTFQLKEETLPDWLYGYISVDNNVCLPTEGSPDDFKEGIFAVIEDSVLVYARKIAAVLRGYEIAVNTCKAELVERKLTLACSTNRPVMQVNQVMSNKKVRSVLRGNITIAVATFVEEARRTDDYLGGELRPYKQIVSRVFNYQDGMIVRNEPDHWSAGMEYADGDIIRVGAMQWKVDGEAAAWVRAARATERQYTESFRDERRRTQVGTPFQPGERAYWNIARNR